MNYSVPLWTRLHHAIYDTADQWIRKCNKYVRPFRYWNFLSLLKWLHTGLVVQGFLVFFVTNRLFKSHSASTATGLVFSRRVPWLRRYPLSESEGMIQASWGLFSLVGKGFPFFSVRHPDTRCRHWFRRWLHPTLYWSYLSVYKIVWSTWHVVRIADLLTDPKRLPPSWHQHSKVLQILQRERIIQWQNLRYQHQWNTIQADLQSPWHQRSIKALKIENRWVSLGTLGAAIQDVIDDARDRVHLRPQQVMDVFAQMGTSLQQLQEVSIAMSLSLPLQALSQLLEHAPQLTYLRLDGVAFSIRNPQVDIVRLGRALHGSANAPLALKQLRLEYCRLENDEPDPQLRQRYSMDLLLSPAIFTSLHSPTWCPLQHLTLWTKCQLISALELAVMLGNNTSLKSLDLHLVRDRANNTNMNNNNHNNNNHNINNNNNLLDVGDAELEEILDEEINSWFIVPLTQVLQSSNQTLQKLTLYVDGDIERGSLCYRALLKMMQTNETLVSLKLIRTDTHRRIRIGELEFYLQLNRLGRRQFRNDYECVARQRWIETIVIPEKRHTAIMYYFLSLQPALLLPCCRKYGKRGGKFDRNRKGQYLAITDSA